jgi:hypothetical protein
MNIDRSRGVRGFINKIAPYATSVSSAALGLVTGSGFPVDIIKAGYKTISNKRKRE